MSNEISAVNAMVASTGYFKASNTQTSHMFGFSLALSTDGNTLAVGAIGDDSNATGINGNQADVSASNSGAVYIFSRGNNGWVQQAYVKASNTDADDSFGVHVALSSDGNTLAVGAVSEDSNANAINSDQASNTAINAGAVYVFVRTNGNWSQQAYIKASNAQTADNFGIAVALSADGNTLVAGAYREDSNATGINGNQTNNSTEDSGAVYVFTRADINWSQQAYIKSSSPGASDLFGNFVSVSADGNTLVTSAYWEDSNATGINGNDADNSATNSGAVYIFSRTGIDWSQQAYVKASNARANAYFGNSVSVSADGNLLAVSAFQDASNATGINGNQADISALGSGAAYVFARVGTVWSQQAYIKASNTEADDRFGYQLALSADGNSLAVGAVHEDSALTGIDANQTDNAASNAGAVYVFARNVSDWTQQSYVKASNTDAADEFGRTVALSGDGRVLVTGTISEDSNASGIDGDQTNNLMGDAGAVYVY
jgi:trimeric autotransporter adhesin